eukprot:COSAG02_NODE_2718_length_8166_cov_53.761497_2_plen_76_part_00
MSQDWRHYDARMALLASGKRAGQKALVPDAARSHLLLRSLELYRLVAALVGDVKLILNAYNVADNHVPRPILLAS